MVHLRIDVHWNGAAEHQRVDDAAVDVAGHDDLVSPLAHRQHHSLHRAGGTSYHQKGMGRTESIRGQLLRLPDHGNGMAQVVQGVHAVYVNADALFSQKGSQFRISPAPLMPGHIERDNAHLPERLKRLVYGGFALVQIPLSYHLPTPQNAKKHKLHLCSLCLDQRTHKDFPPYPPGSRAELRQGQSKPPEHMLGTESLYSNKILLLLFY